MCAVAANAYELNNLDNAALDAPIFAHSPQPFGVSVVTSSNAAHTDFVSLPCETLLTTAGASLNASNGAAAAQCDGLQTSFGRRQPMYQSAYGMGTDCVDGGPTMMGAHILGKCDGEMND